MKQTLALSVGQYSIAGTKALNQDALQYQIPKAGLLNSKGAVFALSDGISSSNVSQIASRTAVDSFTHDYYSTPCAWSTKNAALKVLKATNYWLHAQSKNSEFRFDLNKGYVATFSAMVFKSNTLHTLHCGDSRIYRYVNHSLEQLTQDHRRYIDEKTSYLSRALGLEAILDIDYAHYPLAKGEHYILATDGVYEFVSPNQLGEIIDTHQTDLDHCAKVIVHTALENGSDDNLSVMIVAVEQLPSKALSEWQEQAQTLKSTPTLTANQTIDDYLLIRELFIGGRSHVFLAQDLQTQQKVVFKAPSMELKHCQDTLESLLMEEWVMQRLSHPNLLKTLPQPRSKSCVYSISEYVSGTNLAQWMLDHPDPDLDSVRTILVQVGKGLQALHRQEIIHRDIRPNNIIITPDGLVKIIDFGAVRVAGVSEILPMDDHIKGTAQFSAPEYFLGEIGTQQADIFSLGVLAYQMLTGKLPYGTHVARCTTHKSQQALHYVPANSIRSDIPHWVEGTIAKAVKVNPQQRYTEVSEFLADLITPNPKFQSQRSLPMIEKNPVQFWQACSAVLLVLWIMALLS
ncbi:bifunctional protein-serine/threonine kinase/phosphatase [Shewanella gaetbuli]|uniref:Bifunctional protein-serine/threonine kinase/phosphatase n=1 Tax=Shewanella gaetbuli TaxID=220752 RepID=A0A9X2CI10_9GAMM|nr:bifunctional protein-serine/threonine kinase/phosphatase [Shewanella gaetbuli]MCL1144093.1 bifunctional protein-serine/threonine kinase/phosphatase [Shewanella gaetbuli]